MLFDYRQTFPDRYSLDKGWVRVVPIQGRPIQTAELTEIQSILHESLRHGLNYLIGNGTKLEGLTISIDNVNDPINVTLRIADGLLYVEGVVLQVPGRIITLPRVGRYEIGIEVFEEVVEDEDSLREITQITGLPGLEGSSRIVWRAQVLINGEDVYRIGVLDDGVILEDIDTPTRLEQDIALLNYERWGNYISQGLVTSANINNPSPTSNNNDLNLLRAQVNTLNEDITVLNTVISDNTSRLAIARATPDNDNLIDELTSRINRDRLTLTARQAELISVNNRISNNITSTSTTASRLVINVGPGVAYIQGHRLVKSYPTQLSYSYSLDEESVNYRKLLFTRVSNPIYRGLTLNGVSSFDEARRIGTELVIRLTNVSYKNELIPIVLTIPINQQTPLLSIDDVLRLIVNTIDGSDTRDIIRITTRLDLSLPRQQLINLVRNNISISIVDARTISMSSKLILKDRVAISIVPNNLITTNNDIAVLDNPTQGIYYLGSNDISRINSLVADQLAIRVAITRGSIIGGEDYLLEDTVSQVVRVYQNDITYIQGRDYTLNNNRISWESSSLDAIEPPIGSTYLVDYIYSQELTLDVDYRLREGSIEFIGRTPVTDSFFTVAFTYSLRLVISPCMDKTGEVFLLVGGQGVNPLPPGRREDCLSLADILISKDKVTITPTLNSAINQSSTETLLGVIKSNEQRIKGLEALINSIRLEGQDYKVLNYQPLAEIIDIPNSQISITDTGLVSVPMLYESRYINTSERTLRFTERLLHSNEMISRYRSIYNRAKAGGVLQITPSEVFIHDADLTRSLCLEAGVNTIDNIQLTETIVEHRPLNANYVRPVEFTLKCSLLPPRVPGFLLFIDGVLVRNYTLLSDSIQVDSALVSSVTGSIHIRITYPLSPGSHLIELVHPDYYSKGLIKVYDGSQLATIRLTDHCNIAEPIQPAYTNTIRQRISSEGLAPLGTLNQVFRLNEPTYISKIGIRLRQISLQERLFILIRSVVNGRPNKDVLAIGLTDLYQPSETGDLETLFSLGRALLLEADKDYVVSLVALSNGYECYTSKLGETPVRNKLTSFIKPNYIGNLYLSYDGIFNQLLPDEFLNISIYGLSFIDSNREIDIVSSMTLSPINSLAIQGVDIVPLGTSITYQYRDGNNWLSLDPIRAHCINTNTLSVRAVLNSTRGDLSPELASRITILLGRYGNGLVFNTKPEGLTTPLKRFRLVLTHTGDYRDVSVRINNTPMNRINTKPGADIYFESTWEITLPIVINTMTYQVSTNNPSIVIKALSSYGY